MAKTGGPRHGSMQFWPRKRAKSEIPRLRSRVFAGAVDGFYGYKVGMTHITFKDTGSTSLTKNQVISQPATVIECPPLKVAGVRFYEKKDTILTPCTDKYAAHLDKELSRSFHIPKGNEKLEAPEHYTELRLIAYTQPKLTALGKKKPEIFELALAGSKEEQLAYAQEKFGKEITIGEVFKQHDLIDIHAVTTGRGYQGPVKRFGVQIRAHKSEKTKRGPGSLGPWKGQQHIMYRVAHAGQTGYHLRLEFNKPIVYIGDDFEQVNPVGGFIRYGEVQNPYVVVLGSIPGPRKRMVRITPAKRPNPKKKTNALQLQTVSKLSRQR